MTLRFPIAAPPDEPPELCPPPDEHPDRKIRIPAKRIIRVILMDL